MSLKRKHNNSYLIKVLSNNKLLCKLCGITINNEALWETHCKTKQHIDVYQNKMFRKFKILKKNSIKNQK